MSTRFCLNDSPDSTRFEEIVVRLESCKDGDDCHMSYDDCRVMLWAINKLDDQICR